MEQAGIIAIGLFMAGVIFYLGWYAHAVADHDRRLAALERMHGEFLERFDRVYRHMASQGG